MAEIRLERLEKRFGDVVAVQGIDLDVPDGRVTVLVGPSGCGKTTTLRMIAGLEEATAGRILIGGRDVTNLEPKKRDVAMVFQNYALYPHMNVYDNIAFGLRAKNLGRREIDERVCEAAALLGVEALLRRKPRALSGGQQQRVAIGRAIVRQPAAFLFDEPLSNLDAKLRVEMRTEILRIQRELKTTIVHVTHDQEEAMTLADELIVMREGEVIQRGRPAEVYARPETEFVATFIGSPAMNIIPGRASGCVFEAPGLRVPVPVAGNVEMRLGVRPEDVYVAKVSPPGATTPSFRARVEVIELLGARAILLLRVASDLTLKALVDASALSHVGEGREAEFAFRRESLHAFSSDAERRLSLTS